MGQGVWVGRGRDKDISIMDHGEHSQGLGVCMGSVESQYEETLGETDSGSDVTELMLKIIHRVSIVSIDTP